MKLLILASLLLLSACASAENFESLLETKAIDGVCFTKQITRITVINGKAGTLLGTVDADIHITETVNSTYEDKDC